MTAARFLAGHGYREGRQRPRIAPDVGPWAVVLAQRALQSHPERMVAALAALTVGVAYARLHGYSEDEVLLAVREAYGGRNRLVPVRVVPTTDSIARDYRTSMDEFRRACEAVNDVGDDAAMTVKAMVATCLIVAGRLVAYSRTTREELERAASLVWRRQPAWWTAPVAETTQSTTEATNG